jgi:hypothetical protein
MKKKNGGVKLVSWTHPSLLNLNNISENKEIKRSK